jgi:cell division protein FtsI (penicillin-binding protein 3)
MTSFLKKTLHMTGSRRTALDIARGRIVIVSALFVIAYIIVAGRAFDVAVIQGTLGAGEKTSMFGAPDKNAPAFRQDITDRNGIILARSLKTASLYADPKLIADPAQVAKDLTTVFRDVSYGETLKKLQEDKRFVWIKRNLTPGEQYKILYLGHPGLAFQEEERRLYPQGELAAHMVGITNVDGGGLSGVEASFNKYLAAGKAEPLALTLDVRLQHALRREIAAAVKKHRAIGGAGIIMDVASGEILGAVSLPDFDPNLSGDVKDKSRFNRLTLGVYEPGSTFKIFTTAAYLEKNKNGIDDTFDATRPIKYGRFTINDYHAEKRRMNVPEIFMHSSNIGSALMGQAVGTEDFKNLLSDLGLMSAPDVEIAEISAPLIPRHWGEINTITASFGHGISVSPLQLVTAAASVVNGGLRVKPTLVLNRALDQEPGLRVVSPETAHRLRELMRLVVTDGTGSKADVKGYHVGGKTGTAEKNAQGGYDKNKLVSSFLGVFPSEAPKYAVYVMIDEPKPTADTYGYATGGWVAAPAVRRTIESMVAILGIPPIEDKNDLKGSLARFVKSKEDARAQKASHEAR